MISTLTLIYMVISCVMLIVLTTIVLYKPSKFDSGDCIKIIDGSSLSKDRHCEFIVLSYNKDTKEYFLISTLAVRYYKFSKDVAEKNFIRVK